MKHICIDDEVFEALKEYSDKQSESIETQIKSQREEIEKLEVQIKQGQEEIEKLQAKKSMWQIIEGKPCTCGEEPPDKIETNARLEPEIKIKPTVFLRSADICMPKFEYDKDSKQFYENVFFWELPDDRVVIEYGEAHYYTTKQKILAIPYPPPANYYDAKRGWNSTNAQAIKKYRKHLAEHTDPDRKFRKVLNTDTRPGAEEKVEGTLET
jgi:predicted CopG family antitoxin